MAPEALAPSGRLMIVGGPGKGHRYALGAGTMLIGRSEDCDLTLADSRASSRHASIEWAEGEGYILKDLDSQNGTRINGAAASEHRLADMDRIEIADSTLIFESHE